MRVCVCARGFGGSGGLNVINSHPSKKKKKESIGLLKGEVIIQSQLRGGATARGLMTQRLWVRRGRGLACFVMKQRRSIIIDIFPTNVIPSHRKYSSQSASALEGEDEKTGSGGQKGAKRATGGIM